MNLPTDLLKELPDWLRNGLDISGFASDTAEAGTLGKLLEAHVVSYRDFHAPVAEGRFELCQMLEMADLDDEQLTDLKVAEQKQGVTLVAYAKPMKLRER